MIAPLLDDISHVRKSARDYIDWAGCGKLPAPTRPARSSPNARPGMETSFVERIRICPILLGSPRVNILSIQSHVAYGHVGNASAVFPMQRLGFEVWPIHTVQFSNHVGYEDWAGQVFSPEHVREVVDGIERRGAFADCAAILSGYMGDAALVEAVLHAVERVRAGSPDALFACDPVMGDTGVGLYVEPDIVGEMRHRAVPAADLITPNQFELEQLTGITVGHLDDALAATRKTIAMGPRIVLLTSLRHDATPDDSIEMLLTTEEAAYRVRTPFLAMDPMPHGSGDAVCALFLAHLLRRGGGPDALPEALADAAAAIFAIMAATAEAGADELALIPAQDEIAAPSRRFPVEKVS